ncbi:MAG: DegT/DnrJ/EryC1/StrS family aminotransferase [Thermoproteota archaeon]
MKLAINGGERSAAKLGGMIPPWPVADEEAKRSVLEVLEGNDWCRIYEYSRVRKFEIAFADYHDASHAIAVANGTVALELALLASGVKAGDEVLVPALTFIASASAIACVGAVPIFVDSDPETLSISPKDSEAKITDKTRAIIGVHYAGYPIDFDAIKPLAKRNGLILIEDCAHAHGTEWKGRKVGAIGDMGGFSFQASKSLAAGEGGVVLTDDDKMAERAELIHNIGRVVGKPGYLHYVLSSNYRMTEMQGALLLSLMRHLPWQTEYKHEVGAYLAERLRRIGGVEPLKSDERITKRGYYFFVIKYDASEFGGIDRDTFLRALGAEGVPCGKAYGVPLYRNEAFLPENLALVGTLAGQKLPDYSKVRLPVVEKFCAEQQVTIPHTVLLAGRKGADMIADAIAKIKENADELRTKAGP